MHGHWQEFFKGEQLEILIGSKPLSKNVLVIALEYSEQKILFLNN
jgi:hypothetical protein